MDYKLDFSPVLEGLPNLLWGCLGTLGLALGGMALAIVIGIGGVVLRDSRIKPVRWLVMAFVEVIRNTPFLVQIYFIFFALPLAGIRLDPTAPRSSRSASTAAPTPSRSFAAACSRSTRARSKPAWRLACTRRQVFRLIVLKPALRAIYPVADQPVRSADADHQHRIGDLGLRADIGRASGSRSDTFRSFEVYGTITLLYLVMSWLMMRIFELHRRALLQLSGQVRSNAMGKGEFSSS